MMRAVSRESESDTVTIRTRLSVADLAAVPLPAGRLSKLAFDTGDVELRLYAPAGCRQSSAARSR